MSPAQNKSNNYTGGICKITQCQSVVISVHKAIIAASIAVATLTLAHSDHTLINHYTIAIHSNHYCVSLVESSPVRTKRAMIQK